jgi:hypothetical protein
LYPYQLWNWSADEKIGNNSKQKIGNIDFLDFLKLHFVLVMRIKFSLIKLYGFNFPPIILMISIKGVIIN